MAKGFPFDMTKFTKTGGDKNMTMLTHKDGHTLTIAHGALSKEMRKQLESIPHKDKGGEIARPKRDQQQHMPVPVTQDESNNRQQKITSLGGYAQGGYTSPQGGQKFSNSQEAQNAADMQRGAQQSGSFDLIGGIKDNWNRATGSSDSQQPSNMARGGKIQTKGPQFKEARTEQGTPQMVQQQSSQVQNYADGTPDGGASNDAPDSESVPINTSPVIPDSLANPNPGSQATSPSQLPSGITVDTPAQQAISADMPYGVSKEDVAKMYAAKDAPQPSTDDPQPATESKDPDKTMTNVDPYGQQQMADTYAKGFGMQEAGLKAQGQHEAEQAQNDAQIAKDSAASQQTLLNLYQQHYSDLDKERIATQDDIKNHLIDPEHYMNSRSTATKFSNGIGMLLGGMSAGTLGGENPAVKMLQMHVNNDIEAQRANLGARDNLLSANLKQFGNLRDATDMTRIQLNDVLVNKIRESAAMAGSNLAIDRAKQGIGAIINQSAQIQGQVSMRRTLMNAAQHAAENPQSVPGLVQAYRQFGMADQAKALQERYVPGVGVSDAAPVTNEDRNQFADHQKFQAASDDLRNFVNTHSTLIPGTKDYNIGAAKASALQQTIRETMLGTVFRESEKPLLNKLLSDNPAGLLKNVKTLPQLNELDNANRRGFTNLTQKYGMHGGQSSQQGQPQRQAPGIQTKGGVQYMLDPTGKYMVPVK